jgi:uncharacterized protein
MLALFALLLVGCDAGQAGQQVGNAVAAPAPTTFPALTGRVVDGAELLDEQAAARISGQSRMLEAATGNQFVVVTVPTLGGQSIEDFGLALGRHWGVGRVEHDDGILLIVAPTERRVRIEVGYGLEKTMTNARAQTIINEHILPHFGEGRMQDGIRGGADAIVAVLADKEDAR